MNTPKAKKGYGQHYLTNKNVVEQIITAFDPSHEAISSIIEVGPGPGTLTFPLLEWNLPLAVVEADARMRASWDKKIEENRIFITDAAQINVANLIKDAKLPDEKIWLVSNLPYNAGVPIMVNFIKEPRIKYMTLMFQKEVAQKICLDLLNKKDQRKNMSSIAAICQNYFEISSVCKVAPGSFSPPPKVQSAVIKLKRLENPVVPLEQFQSFEKFLKMLFGSPRKTLLNNLKSNLGQKAAELLELGGIDSQQRGETLNLEQVQLLYEKFKLLRST